MPAFDGVIKTKTRVPIDKDSFMPGMGTLQKASGSTEQALIHGIQKLHVDKDVKEEIIGSYNLKIMQTSTTFVLGNVDVQYLANYDLFVGGMSSSLFVGIAGYTYMSLRNDKMLGPQITSNIGPKFSTFVAPLTESHASPRQITEPAARFSILGQDFTIQANSFTATPMAVALYGFMTQACGAQISAAGASLQPMVLNLQVSAVAAALNGIGTTLNIAYIANGPIFLWTGIKLGVNQVM